MRNCLGTLWVLLSATFIVAAESPDSLVKKLGSTSYAEREAASAELLKLGSSALAAVKNAAESSSDPEVRERAQALVDPLNRASDSARLLVAKPVTFTGGNAVPLASAIADFKQKTGIPLQLVTTKVNDSVPRMVTLPAGEYPPWEALAILLKAAGLREDHRVELPANGKDTPNQGMGRYNRHYYDGNEVQMIYTVATAPILLVDGPPDTLPANRSGGVRVLALPANFAANRVVRGAGRVVFHLDAAPVPSTGWHGASGVRIIKAEDEDGRPVFADLKLAHDPIQNNYYNGWNGGFGGRRAVFWGGGGMQFDDGGNGGGQSPNHNPRLVPVAIRTNDRALKTLRKFEGAVLGEVHTPNVAVITVDKLENATATQYSGPQNSSLQVQEYKKHDNGTYTVKVRHEALTQWALQNLKGMAWGGNYNDNPGEVLNRMKFYDADGKELTKPAQESTSYNGDGWRQSVEVMLRFTKSAAPVKMVVTGTKITNVEVPFNLENVSVP